MRSLFLIFLPPVIDDEPSFPNRDEDPAVVWVVIAGMSRSPDGRWVTELARNLTDPECGFLMNVRFLIRDRDPLFTEAFGITLESSGVRPVKLPPRSPNLNAYAERFVRSIKSECSGQVMPIGKRHLRLAVREYAEHYHRERNQQGLGNELIDRRVEDYSGSGSIECRERLGGLLRHYRRAAQASIEFWHTTTSIGAMSRCCTAAEPYATSDGLGANKFTQNLVP